MNTTNLIEWIQMVTENGNVPVKCPNCGHRWEYGGEKRNEERATCPNCLRKNPVRRLRIDE